ncbi:site-specific integrase [Paraburkholderia sp. MMS20-SJTR3]|uniref:Site-specific integrase n=1 Tax=Paraburkholderia sejongensis TaxID=2886946 RepID=A0ABS8JWJ3_9BURK|nr:site-specific integrase [Paraburkholderia sp. MMS20-SJTR3]MCC8394238.1 site-specific integrase [Paraburkholderia sp. MMS20-SJTR3]
MQGISCLYRRPSGIYAVRLVVPKRLRAFVGRTEIHTSTGVRSLPVAKTEALRIQLHWRKHFQAMDAEKLRNESPLIAGDGMISITAAADAIGISPGALAGELLNDRAQVYTHVQGLRGWAVPDLNDIERDYDGGLVLNDVESKGVETTHSGMVRFLDTRATLGRFVVGAKSAESVLRHGARAAVILDDELEVSLSECVTTKTAVAQVRARLALSVPPASPVVPTATTIPPAPPASPTVTPSMATPIIHDAITARQGSKRFSDLFELYKQDRSWSEGQTRRMTTEAGLFKDLMGDPALGDIEKETVLEFARLLALLPTDIHDARRNYFRTTGETKTLHELIELAKRDGRKRKNEDTVKRHVGNVSQILGYGVKAGLMHFNPASGYKRGRSAGAGSRPQDDRQTFEPDELERIFSQDWFARGAGAIRRNGFTHWRPHYYWLPLLGLLTGGRINELSQLYLDDIRQSEAGVWYLDFNLDGDKVEDVPDKSLKTVNAVRVVPIHAELVRLGLPEYVERLRRAGHTRLFPELKRDPVKGYGKPAGSWFNERFLGNRLGIERNGRKTFHSFRHTFVTALDRLELPERILAQLAGHERGTTQAGIRYTKDRSADELAEIFARLHFPALAGVAPFRIGDALVAIKCAERQKVAASRREQR